jgi:hypothetical protein
MLLVLAVPFLGVIASRIARPHCMPASGGLVTGGPAHTFVHDETDAATRSFTEGSPSFTRQERSRKANTQR